MLLRLVAFLLCLLELLEAVLLLRGRDGFVQVGHRDAKGLPVHHLPGLHLGSDSLWQGPSLHGLLEIN